MHGAREEFLEQVRRAVAMGNQAGRAPALPARGNTGYQGAGPNPVARFAEELSAAGGNCHVVRDPAAARQEVIRIIEENGARRVVLAAHALLSDLDLAQALAARGLETWCEPADPAPQDLARTKETVFAADAGVTGVEALIAETGSVIVASGPGSCRSLSLLPPVYVAVAARAQLVPDLFDWFESRQGRTLPACFAAITGPSKTGDIELRLVTGVHGPGVVHVVLIDP